MAGKAAVGLWLWVEEAPGAGPTMAELGSALNAVHQASARLDLSGLKLPAFTAPARTHTRIRDPQLKIVSGALLAVVAWMVLYNMKSQYLDFDPMNIYFWLFAGMAMKLPLLQREPGEPEATPVREPVPVEV